MFVESEMITDIYYSVGLTNNDQSVISFDTFLLCSEQESCSVIVATIESVKNINLLLWQPNDVEN